MSIANFYTFLTIMAICAVIVFFCLYFVDAGYGKFYNSKWGPSINNRLGWVLMEAPVFVAMLILWLCSNRRGDATRLVFLLLFELHYFQRSFIFPLLIRGESRMPGCSTSPLPKCTLRSGSTVSRSSREPCCSLPECSLTYSPIP